MVLLDRKLRYRNLCFNRIRYLFGISGWSNVSGRSSRMHTSLRTGMKQYQERFSCWFGNRPIKSKILLLYVPLIVIPLLILGFISNLIFVHVTLEKTTRAVEDDSRMISVQINTKLSNMENCANITALNLIQFYRNHQSDTWADADALTLQRQKENVLRISSLSFEDVDTILFIDSNQNAVTLNPKMLVNLDKGLESEHYHNVLAHSPANVWFPMERRDFFTEDVDEAVLSLGKWVIDPDTGDTLGVLILNLKESSLADVFPRENSSAGHIVMLDRNENVVVSRNSQELLHPFATEAIRQEMQKENGFHKMINLKGQRFLVAGTKLQRFGWKLVILVPFEELAEGVGSSMTIMVLLIATFMFLILLSARFLSARTVEPIVMLTEKMREVQEGKFAVSIRVHTTDEVGELASGFQEMMDKINDLTQQAARKQKKLREYELALIQAQIKPHFLYNSLGLIYTMCGMAGAKEAQIAAKSLADFYRGVLSEGREIILVEEEIQNVRNYLYIQSRRFSDMFDYEISVDEKLLHKKIPKLSLQPIVENSIHHGLVPRGCGGHLQLTGRLDGTRIIFVVADNGVGMERQVLLHLLDRRQEQADGGGSFGLRSVHERFQLFYGDQYGVTVQSEKGKGTKVTLTMPLNGE